MKKVNWVFKGMAPMGDQYGPIYLSHALIDGKKIVRAVHGNGKTRFNGFPTLAKALKS